VQVDVAAKSDPGLARGENQDHYVVLRFGRAMECLFTDLPAGTIPNWSEEVGYGMFVADGVGGAAAGEAASRVAIATLLSLALHTPDWILSSENREVRQVMERFADRYRHIDATLRELGQGDPKLSGMGTTMTLACSLGRAMIIGHIGDSRAYLFRGGRLQQLTHDHTLLQTLIDTGQINPEEAAQKPFYNVLTRSLGGGPKQVDGEFQRAWLADGDQLLLCTDGLTAMVDDAAIASILGGTATASEGCQALVAAALGNGGMDNVTVVLARYRFPP
jgi:protein phosphatase